MHTLKCIAHFCTSAQTALGSHWASFNFCRTTVFAAKDFSETPSAPVLTWKFKGILTTRASPLISIYAYYALHSGSNLCPSWLSRAVNMLRRGVFNTYLAFNVYLVHYQTLFCTDIVHFFHVLIPIYMQWYLCFRCTSYPSHFYILDCWSYTYSGGLYAGLCAAVVSDLRSTG